MIVIFSEKNKLILIFSEKNKMFLMASDFFLINSQSGLYLRILNMKENETIAVSVKTNI